MNAFLMIVMLLGLVLGIPFLIIWFSRVSPEDRKHAEEFYKSKESNPSAQISSAPQKPIVPPEPTPQPSWVRKYGKLLLYLSFLFGVPFSILLGQIDPILMWIGLGIYGFVVSALALIGGIEAFSGRGGSVEGRGPDINDSGG